jgi:hypothetical protein
MTSYISPSAVVGGDDKQWFLQATSFLLGPKFLQRINLRYGKEDPPGVGIEQGMGVDRPLREATHDAAVEMCPRPVW